MSKRVLSSGRERAHIWSGVKAVLIAVGVLLCCSMWRFVVFVHAKIGELKVKDLSQKLQGISGFIFHLQLCDGLQLKHQILLKAHTE